MTYKKLHLYRNRIDDAVRSFMPDDATLVREDESAQRVKYIVTFADESVPSAMLIIDFNADGTTTIEDCRGKNKEYTAKLAEHVAKMTQVSLYDAGNLYFRTITDEQFGLFTDYMSSCNATLTSTTVLNGTKYTICGEYGDRLYATRFNNGSVHFQGHPSITFNNAISILSDIYPSDVILVGLTKFYNIDFERADLEKELFSHCPKLVGEMSTDVVDAVLPTLGLRRAVPEGLTDYSYLCFPILRGLEGLIKTMFKSKGVILQAKNNFGGYLKYDETNHTASLEPAGLLVFTNETEKIRVEGLYSLLCQQRHRIFHFDALSPILLEKDIALDIVDEILKAINDAY